MNHPRMSEAQTPQQAYEAALSDVLADVNHLDEQSVRHILSLLKDARQTIIDSLQTLPSDAYLASYQRRLQRQIEDAMARYVQQYSTYLDGQAKAFWDLGISSVDVPLSAADISIMVALPSLEPRMLDILSGYRAALITGVENDVVDKLTVTIQQGILTGASPYDIQKVVSDLLRTTVTPEGTFNSIAARSQALVRTEMNRVFSLSAQSRQENLAARVKDTFPEIQAMKVWLTAQDDRVRPSHRRMDGQKVPIGEEFILIGADGITYKIMQPHDARLPVSESTN